jgi:hypothetical protein
MNDPQETHTQHPIKTAADTPTPLSTPPACDDGDGSAEAVAVPMRYWWLKRIVLASIVIPAVLFGLQRWWDHDAERRLQVEIDRIVAAGEPIYPQDFDPKEVVPNVDNAARAYIAAGSALVLSATDQDFVYDCVDDKETVSTNLPKLRSLVEINQEALRLVRQASALTRADWGVRMRTPMINTLLPNLSSQRSLGKFVLAAALLRWEEGDSREAFTLLEDAIAQAKATDVRPFLIEHLVALAQYDLTWKTVETILPTLEVSSETTGGAQTAILRSRVTDLIERLREEDAFRDAHILAMQTERAMMIDSICAVADGRISIWTITGGDGPPSSVMQLAISVARPVLNEDISFMLHRLNRVVLAARQPTWPAAEELLPSENYGWTGLDVWLHYLSWKLERSIYRDVMLHYRGLAMRRMTRIALAIRLFEMDHGARPVTLQKLVPKYLTALPVDPFDKHEGTFGYLPDAVRPRLYSFGGNGFNNDGDVAFATDGSIRNFDGDLPFFLSGARPWNVEELSLPVNLPSPSH